MGLPLVACGGLLLLGFLGWYYLIRSPAPLASRTQSPTQPDGLDSPAASVNTMRPTDGSDIAALPPVPVTEPETAKGVIAEIERVLEHLVRRFPNQPDAHEVKARLHAWKDETAEAAEAWQRCLQLEPSYSYAYEGLASVASQRGNHRRAIELYQKALAVNPDSSRTRTALAKALLAEGEIDEAVAVLQETVESSPTAIEAFYQLATAYQRRKELAKAKESYEKTLALEPRYAAAQIGLARVYTQLGLDEQARQHQEKYRQLRTGELKVSRQDRQRFDDLQATRQDVAELYTAAGRIYLAEGDPASAKLIWNRAALLDPQDVNSRRSLAWLHAQQGEPLQIIRRLREMADLDPENPTYPLEIGLLYLRMDRVAESEKTLEELCQKAPDYAPAQAALAKLYLQTNQKFPQALELAEKAVELEPTAEHYVLLSGCHERMSNWKEAAEAMARAVEEEPQNGRYRQLHELLKQQESAKQE